MTRIVVVGGGFAGVYTIKNLLKFYKNSSDVEIVLINKNNYFLFTLLLHEVATGGINFNNMIEPIRDILKGNNFKFIESEVKKVNLKDKIVFTEDKKIKYDFLVISIGAKDNFYKLDGAEKYCLKLKTLDDARLIKNRLIGALEEYVKQEKKDKSLLNFIVIGGGPTGVELVGEIADFLYQIVNDYKEINKGDIKIYLVHKGEKLIPLFGDNVIKDTQERLVKKGIIVLLNTNVNKVGVDYIEINNKKIFSKTIIWGGGVSPNTVDIIPKVTNNDNFFEVDERLHIKGYNSEYAIGDCALFFNKNAEKAVPAMAQVAVDQAKFVAENIKARNEGEMEKEYFFKPKGFVLSVGQKFASGDIFKIHSKGFIVWLLWKSIYWFKLVGIRNKIRTLMDWIIGLFSKRDTSRF